ncbi:hypothetical protein DPMN_189289 [Dreissena polymorpha]|uniref:Uncharacterized protein n=1 Tax=Dreissena polymorpha TaxID=45954 RepID=A0A9D4DVA2_DREPO|nr:hypothetical protein DPMN_189289 [Dreissena polymorpha]
MPQPPHNDVNPTETETIKIYMIKPLTDSLSSTPDLICVDADSIELRMDTLSTQSAPDNYAHDSINMREETFKIVKQTSKTSILSTFETSLLVPSFVSRTGNALNGSIAMRYIPTVVDEQKSNTSISSSKESYLNVHGSTAECSKTSETSMFRPSIVSPMGDLSCAMNILPVKTEPFESGMYAQAISSTTKNAVVETSDQLNSTHVSESSHDSLSWLNSSIFKEELLVDDVTTGQYVVQIYKVCDDGEIKVEADS